ncbi:MAG: transcription antitermination factor NusB [Pseudomonadota bacterium]|nr:transcription antitermination factor NusB [Pseudomonadota bacterium]
MSEKTKFSPSARTAARQRALQALYQWQMTEQSIQLIESQFFNEENMTKVDVAYFQKLLHGIPQNIQQLDATITPPLDRHLHQLDPVELAILRIGCYELLYCPDIPFRVVINEAVELAKRFGANKSHKYINGILDKLAHNMGKIAATPG